MHIYICVSINIYIYGLYHIYIACMDTISLDTYIAMTLQLNNRSVIIIVPVAVPRTLCLVLGNPSQVPSILCLIQELSRAQKHCLDQNCTEI